MISREDIVGLAKLARLNLHEPEIAALQKDVSGILEYVGQISALDAIAVDPSKTGGVPKHRNVLRADMLRAEGDQLTGAEALVRAQFPKEDKGYNVVRKIIQKDS